MWNTLRRLMNGSHPTDPAAGRAPVAFDLSGSSFQVLVGNRWQDAPDSPEVPPGTHLSFRFEMPRDHDVAWAGARETALTLRRSEARVDLTVPGEHAIRVDVLDLAGHRVASVQTQVSVRVAA